jgi:DNA-binding response OmpR family regulator
MKRILLAEDDADFAAILQQYLRLHDFDVVHESDGDATFKRFKEEKFDVCILDVMMPKTDGFTLASRISKHNPETPFLFLTARQLKEDRLYGLKLGADDYIAKPFEAEELVLRLNNILKRSGKVPVQFPECIQIGKFTFDTQRLQLRTESSTQQLTEKEAALLSFFYTNRNQLLKRSEILNAVWGSDDFFSGRSMDVFVSRLRKYLDKDPQLAITSVRNVGLEFVVRNGDGTCHA